MADVSRVAVYIDFDNMVISRYDAVHGDQAWRRDDARRAGDSGSKEDVGQRLAEARIDIGAIIDYASSFGTVALTKAYADWSMPANAAYRNQLVDSAVDLVQLFAVSGTKNGADIRLSIDAVDDLLRDPALTHIVIVGGDSDYIALAQRCKRMGRFVVGIGVAESTARALIAACDEFSAYSELPSVEEPVKKPVKKAEPEAEQVPVAKKTAKKAAKKTTKKAAEKPEEKPEASPREQQSTSLLLRAIRVGLEKSDDEWLHASSVKSQMQRMDSTFKEKALGFSSFRAFIESRDDLVETQVQDNGQLVVRLR